MPFTTYKFYHENKNLVESFMGLAHQQYIKCYFNDVLHTGNGISNLGLNDVMFVAFNIRGLGIFSITENNPSELRVKEICRELHRYAGGCVYRFASGNKEYEAIEEYEYKV